MTWTQAVPLLKPDEATSEQLSHFQGFPNSTLLESIGIPIPEIARLALREGQCTNPLYRVHRWFARRLGSQFRAILTWLMNIGKKGGSQIIQLFGRSARLKELDFCVKRRHRGMTKEQFEMRHVLFQQEDKGAYIEKMLRMAVT